MKATQSSCLSAKVEVCLQLEIASPDMKLLVEENLQTPKNIYLAHSKIIPKSFRVRVQSSDEVHEMPIYRLIRVLIRNASPKKNTKRKKESNKFALISHPLQVFVHNFTSVIFCENTEDSKKNILRNSIHG